MKSFMSISTDSRESLLRRNSQLAEQLAKARQENLELKTIIRNYRRAVSIPIESLRSLDTSGKQKVEVEIKSKTSAISPDNDDSNKENILIDKNIISTHSGKKVSPEIYITNGSNKKGSKRSAEKSTKDEKNSPEKEDTIERLSSNSFSPVDMDYKSKLVETIDNNVKKKRRMSYAGHEVSSSKHSDSNQSAFAILSDRGDTDSIQKSKGMKRRSSMDSLPSRNDANRMSLSPSRRPLRLRCTSVDYKETSLKQKMRSSFYIKNVEK